MIDIRIGTLQTRGGDGRRYTLYVYGTGEADVAAGRARFETKDGRLARPVSGGVYELHGTDGPVRLVPDGQIRPPKR